MRAISQYLTGRGFDCVSDETYSMIVRWQRWYRGHVRSFHDYRQYNGRSMVHRRRKTLGMAKTVSEDWACLALNEKVDITTDDQTVTDAVWDILNRNQFRTRGNQLLELTFAMGTGAFVERMDGDDIKIDYVRAGMIYPLAWDNGKITQCAFASERKKEKKTFVYLNIRRFERGEYIIENRMFQRNGESLTEVGLDDDVEEEVHTHSAVPRFQIIKPNVVNNLDPDSPMGISIFANAIDQLQCIDLIYDSYCNEFRLGKKRILVPMSYAKMQLQDTGAVTPVFDDNDTEFYAIPELDGNNKLEEFNMSLRHEAHEAGLQTALNTLSLKVGMGKDRYIFQNGSGAKTATEVVSEKSDLYQSLRKHELLLEDALKSLVLAICDMKGLGVEHVITIDFDDSIIQDTAAQREIDRQDVRDGLLAPYEYRMRWRGEDEETAKMRVSESQSQETPLRFNL